MSREYGIPNCINCTGMHPDEIINMMTVVNRIKSPQKVAANQIFQFEKKRAQGLYNNKSCMLCGRTYDHNGYLDESWELTANRVHGEFENAGIYGVSDGDVKRVVATCIKSWKMLWKNRATIKPEDAEKMTFVGRLTLIITHAQESRHKRDTLNGGKSLNKGLIT